MEVEDVLCLVHRLHFSNTWPSPSRQLDSQLLRMILLLWATCVLAIEHGLHRCLEEHMLDLELEIWRNIDLVLHNHSPMSRSAGSGMDAFLTEVWT